MLMVGEISAGNVSDNATTWAHWDWRSRKPAEHILPTKDVLVARD